MNAFDSEHKKTSRAIRRAELRDMVDKTKRLEATREYKRRWRAECRLRRKLEQSLMEQGA